MMAACGTTVNNQLNIYTTYYDSFLALSVSIRVDKHQLMMETLSSRQAPVLRYKGIIFTTKTLRESLSAVCLVLGVHNVARVRQGASLPLVEVDFTDEKALDIFCKSISDGIVQCRLQDRLKGNLFSSEHEIKVTLKLHMIMPNAESKQSPVSREVTTANYRECFSLIKESALFEFGAFKIDHDDDGIQETIQQELNLSILLQELIEVASIWFTVGVFLNIELYKLEIIKEDNRDQCMSCLREMLATWLKGGGASPAALVKALRLAGMTVLARKMAVKYGVTVFDTRSTDKLTQPIDPQNAASDLIKFFTKLFTSRQDSTTLPIPILNALESQKEGIADKDARHLVLSEQLRELKDNEASVTHSFEQAKSSLESVKNQVDNLKLRQETLIEKRTLKQSSKQWLIKQRGSKTGEDLVQIEKMIIDTKESVAELSNQIDELEMKIKAQNEQVAKMCAQLVQKERKMKQLKIEMDKVHREKSSIESKLEEERRNFEIEMQKMIKIQQKSLKNKCDEKIKFKNEIQKIRNELKLSETREEMMRSELSHQRAVELAQAQSAGNPVPASLLQKVDDISSQPIQARVIQSGLHEQPRHSSTKNMCHCHRTIATAAATVPELVHVPIIIIVFHRKDKTPFGFSVKGGADKLELPHVYTVQPEGIAAADGRLRKGDQILEVNGVKLEGMTHREVASLLKKSGDTLTLMVTRRDSSEAEVRQSSKSSQSESWENNQSSASPSQIIRRSVSRKQLSVKKKVYTGIDPRAIKLHKGPTGLGIEHV